MTSAIGLELKSYVKTPGASGLHILVPLEPEYSYDDVQNFTEIIARLTAADLEKGSHHEAGSGTGHSLDGF